MKKILSLPMLLLIALAFASCNGSDSPEVDSSIVPAGDTAATVTSTLTPDSAQVAQFANSVSPASQAIAGSPAKAGTGVKTSGSSAPNPAHGQPGHRCDIAVGAPLNSAANAPAQPSAQPQITTTSSPKITTTPSPTIGTPSATIATPTATPLSTDPNAKLNPAHGQPGHDCSIAVGAPLKKN